METTKYSPEEYAHLLSSDSNSKYPLSSENRDINELISG